jgi:hypothetical protein
VLVGASLGGCSPALDWREIRPADGVAAALLPCRPAQQSRRVRLADAEVTMTIWSCRAGDVTWAITAADVADPARVGPALAERRAAAQANIGAGAATPLPLDVPGATPNPSAGRIGIAGTRPDGRPVHEQLALFAKGTHVFQATCLGEALPAEAVDAFFAGLRAPP